MSKFTILDDVFDTTGFNGSNGSNGINQQQPPVEIKNFDQKNEIRKAISKLYSGFIMTKIANQSSYSIYKARVDCLTCEDHKYIVAIVKQDNKEIGESVPLMMLQWDVFQTRRTNSELEFRKFEMVSQGYSIKRDKILEDRITKWMELKNEKTLYKSDVLPIRIEVIHMKHDDIFADKGNLAAVLELYQTIIILE